MSLIRTGRHFFADNSSHALPVTFTHFDLDFNAIDIKIDNDESPPGNYIEVSFDGVNVHGRILAGEKFNFEDIGVDHIWLRGQVGGEAYRLMAF